MKIHVHKREFQHSVIKIKNIIRITEWLALEGTSGDHLVQSPAQAWHLVTLQVTWEMQSHCDKHSWKNCWKWQLTSTAELKWLSISSFDSQVTALTIHHLASYVAVPIAELQIRFYLKFPMLALLSQAVKLDPKYLFQKYFFPIFSIFSYIFSFYKVLSLDTTLLSQCMNFFSVLTNHSFKSEV